MAFEFKRTIGGVGRKLELVALADGQAVEVGDAIETYSVGTGTLGVANQPLLGVITSFCDADGIPERQSNPVAGTASGVDQRAIASTSSDYALVDVSPDTIYSAKVSGTLGTTNSSNLRGARLDIDSGNTEYGQLLETTATRTIGTPANFYSHGVDPNDSTRLMVSIAMHEFDGVDE